jgi:hypothetical protein
MGYRVWCIVDGGITGHREAWLKENDTIYETNSRREAVEKAVSLNEKMNNHFSLASFRYTVKEGG